MPSLCQVWQKLISKCSKTSPPPPSPHFNPPKKSSLSWIWIEWDKKSTRLITLLSLNSRLNSIQIHQKSCEIIGTQAIAFCNSLSLNIKIEVTETNIKMWTLIISIILFMKIWVHASVDVFLCNQISSSYFPWFWKSNSNVVLGYLALIASTPHQISSWSSAKCVRKWHWEVLHSADLVTPSHGQGRPISKFWPHKRVIQLHRQHSLSAGPTLLTA